MLKNLQTLRAAAALRTYLGSSEEVQAEIRVLLDVLADLETPANIRDAAGRSLGDLLFPTKPSASPTPDAKGSANQ